MQDYINAFRDLGFPIAVVCVLLYGMHYWTRRAWIDVIIPLTQSLIASLGTFRNEMTATRILLERYVKHCEDRH